MYSFIFLQFCSFNYVVFNNQSPCLMRYAWVFVNIFVAPTFGTGKNGNVMLQWKWMLSIYWRGGTCIGRFNTDNQKYTYVTLPSIFHLLKLNAVIALLSCKYHSMYILGWWEHTFTACFMIPLLNETLSHWFSCFGGWFLQL